MTENELRAALRDCRNELCLKCGSYHNAHNGACDSCRWKDIEDICKNKKNFNKLPTKNRTAQFYSDDPDMIWSYYIPQIRNPCGCGSNCYHYEYDGRRVVGVCNGCDADIYTVEEKLIGDYLMEGIWKEIDKPA